ncbi:hypothetical protein ABW19_dt0203741 [Dactylella cylindrospora]|nr:hypothetical protein ABW19_dt0203741 [Dactylella cylindrospora]
MAPQGTISTTLWASPAAVTSLTPSTTIFPSVTPVVAAAIWRETPVGGNYDPSCTPYILPSLGLLNLEPNSTITLQADATFTPACLINDTLSYLDSNDSLGPHVPQSDLRDPFYASTIPMAYAIGGTTVLAWILLVILLISPPGSRPLLQKVATLSVVISLTIAWAELNEVVEHQHSLGYSNGAQIRDHIIRGLKIQIIRVISDTFLYMAQVQTLIRLFPRHREKLVIKWAGIVLIILDTVFNVINNFFSGQGSPKSFLDAIPALSYLLQIALSLLYACCVLYYMFSHRQFSVMMPWSIKNQHKHASHTSKIAMPLIAVLTTATIFVPLVFFVLDISNQDLAGWGDFVRWVGACAASVIVWEMADRIEYFEKLSMHAGILGRQVFEGDEMLQGIGGRVVDLGDGRSHGYDKGNGPGGGGGGGGSLGRPLDSDEKTGYVIHPQVNTKGKTGDNFHEYPARPTPPLSRAATGSTTYVIRVHPPAITTPPNQARPSSTVSRSTSSVRETNHGTSTISDLAISPTNTPSNETGTSAPRRNITFSDDTGILPSTESPGVGQSKNLSHTYRPGQAPFNPEDFAAKDSESTGHLVFRKGLGFLKRFRLDDNKGSSNSRAVPAEEPNERVEAALGHQVASSESPSNHISIQETGPETGPEDDTFGDHHSIDPEYQPRSVPSPSVQSHSVHSQAREPRPPIAEERIQTQYDDEERGGPVSFLKSLWSRKSSAARDKTFEPLPITYIPAQFRGNNPVNPEEVEEARNRERERIRAGGDCSSEGASSASNSGDAIITRFEQHPSQRSVKATPSTESPYHSSVSPASRLRHSVEFDLENTPAPVSPRRHGHGLGGQNVTPPPPPTRSSTASPNGSVRTSSTGSWQYRATPNTGGVRMNPVNPRPYNPNEGVPSQTHSHPPTSHPEGIGPNIPSMAKNHVPTKLSGRPLDPTVIPEEAEGSSMASIRNVPIEPVVNVGGGGEPASNKGKGKASE